MSRVWRHDENAGWNPTLLAARNRLRVVDGTVRIDAHAAGDTAIVRHGAGRAEHWVLLAPPHTGVWVNGSSVPLGIRDLQDRDEVRLAGAEPVYFSTERLARVEPYPGGETKPALCPRCKQRIEPGSPATCCPQCQAWFHQSDEFGCWLYAETCCQCGQATALNAGYRWTPEEL
jgi:hypothetical protein